MNLFSGKQLNKIEKFKFDLVEAILSRKIVDNTEVVEAGEKSGSFITVDFALEQGRDVYAVPGSITSIHSAGTNNLIKEGAIPVTKYEDVLINV